MSARSDGFTLIEVLAVVLLTSIVLGVAMNFYVDLSRAGKRAASHTRDIRRAAAILDRLARDFERTLLFTRPADVDALSHPWLFYAVSEGASSGSDRVKFVTRNHRPRRSEAHESDLAMVSYTVEAADAGDGSLELWRWSTTQLPESLDKTFPRRDDEGSVLMAEGLHRLAFRFLSESGEPYETWDSTAITELGALPQAVEIEVSLRDPDADPDDFGLEEDEPTTYRRQVLLPLRPFELLALVDPDAAAAAGGADGEGEEGEEGEGEEGEATSSLTVGDCIDFAAAEGAAATDPELADVLDFARTAAAAPWDAYRGTAITFFGEFVRPECL